MKHTKLFGFTRSILFGSVIGLGKTCICIKIYFGKKTKRFGGWCYKMTSREIISTICANEDFEFFGMVRLTRQDTIDLFY